MTTPDQWPLGEPSCPCSPNLAAVGLHDGVACPIGRASNPLPPFDPDPALVADVEGNRRSLRDFRKAAQSAHDQAMRERGER